MKPIHGALPFGGLTGALLLAPAAHADEKGDAILSTAFRTLHAATTMTAKVKYSITVEANQPKVMEGTVVVKKPNLLSYRVAGKRDMKQFVSDGKNYYIYPAVPNSYMREDMEANPRQIAGNWAGEVDAFFGGEANAKGVKAHYAGTKTVNGRPCDIVAVADKQGDVTRKITYAVGKTDHLICRTTVRVQGPPKSYVQTFSMSNIKLNGSAEPSLFAFNPPKGVTLWDPEAKLVAVGEPAPPFELTNPSSKERFSLASALDGRKAVLVNFWFYQ